MNKTQKNSNPNCGIVSDLLPLYYDGVASAGSRILVETHLKCCPDCKKKYDTLKTELPVCETESCSTKKLFKKALRRQLLNRISLYALCVILVFTAIFGLWYIGDAVPVKNITEEGIKSHLVHRYEQDGIYNFFILYSSAAYGHDSTPVVNREGDIYRLDFKTPLLSDRLEPLSFTGENIFIIEDAKDCRELYLGETLIWSRDENGCDIIPEYVYAYEEVRKDLKWGDGWGVSVKENFAFRQYAKTGLMKIWDLEGNLLYKGFRDADGSHPNMPDTVPESLRKILED